MEIEDHPESPVDEPEESAVPPIAQILVAHEQVVRARSAHDVNCVPGWV